MTHTWFSAWLINVTANLSILDWLDIAAELLERGAVLDAASIITTVEVYL